MTFDEVGEIAERLPGVELGTAYGAPALRVKRRFMGRLREDGETLVLRVAGLDEREMLIAMDPAAFFVTDHYRDYPYLLIRLARVRADQLTRVIENAWRALASKRLLAAGPSAQP